MQGRGNALAASSEQKIDVLLAAVLALAAAVTELNSAIVNINAHVVFDASEPAQNAQDSIDQSMKACLQEIRVALDALKRGQTS
jgi:hypothetical protein